MLGRTISTISILATLLLLLTTLGAAPLHPPTPPDPIGHPATMRGHVVVRSNEDGVIIVAVAERGGATRVFYLTTNPAPTERFWFDFPRGVVTYTGEEGGSVIVTVPHSGFRAELGIGDPATPRRIDTEAVIVRDGWGLEAVRFEPGVVVRLGELEPAPLDFHDECESGGKHSFSCSCKDSGAVSIVSGGYECSTTCDGNWTYACCNCTGDHRGCKCRAYFIGPQQLNHEPRLGY